MAQQWEQDAAGYKSVVRMQGELNGVQVTFSLLFCPRTPACGTVPLTLEAGPSHPSEPHTEHPFPLKPFLPGSSRSCQLLGAEHPVNIRFGAVSLNPHKFNVYFRFSN